MNHGPRGNKAGPHLLARWLRSFAVGGPFWLGARWDRPSEIIQASGDGTSRQGLQESSISPFADRFLDL